jgi:hypothetical protein
MLTIFTIHDERYQGYASMWKYFICEAYPQYSAISGMIESKEQYTAACRRFIDQPINEGDVYITDIDMMILWEPISIDLFHNFEMNESGLCYSNSPRNNSEPFSSLRLTGLHYCNQEWYRRTEKSRQEALSLVEKGEIGKGRYDDEIMLKRICEESGLGIPPKRKLILRHHGIHMGTFRNYIMYGPARMRTELRQRISPFQARQFVQISETAEYKLIFKYIKNPIIQKEYEFLEVFCRSRGRDK